jgi:TonB family protein
LTRILTQALRDQNTDLLSLAFHVSVATGTDPDVGTLRAALQTPAREATCWYLTVVEPNRLPADLLGEAAAPTPEGQLPFGCEVLGRIVGGPAARPPARDWASAAGQEAAKGIPLTLVVLQALSQAERKALSTARGQPPNDLDRTLESLKRTTPGRPAAAMKPAYGSAPDTLRLLDLSELPRGLVPDLLAVTGCDGTKPGVWGGAEITYKPDGRPLKVGYFDTNSSLEQCQSAARLLFMTALGPRIPVPRRSGRHVSFVRLDGEGVACAQTSREPSAPKGVPEWTGVRVGAGIKEPKKTKNVAPIYPASAKQRRADGVVIIEAVISASGCISGATVVQQIDPALDMAALRAVSDWRYTPTLLNGVAVPVLMTITINFRLS